MAYFTNRHRQSDTSVTLYYDIFPAIVTPSASSIAILVLHGFGGTAISDFGSQLEVLRERQQVLAPELYGYGRSTQRKRYESTYYREDVEDIVALLKHVQMRKVQIVAFSDGGIVGLLLAALHPELVRSLAVLGAQARIEESDVAAIRHWLLERPLAKEWQEELARLHGEPYWRGLPEMYVRGQEVLLAAGGELISEQELGKIACPTLIMHGKRDRVVGVEYAYHLHKSIQGSKLVVFEAGHAAHLRCWEEYTREIVHFLRENEG